MPDTNDWLMALVSGLGGAFTGAGAARGRRSAEAEVARKAALEAERERRNATTQAMQQEVSLRGIGYVPAEEMTPMRPSFGGTGAAEIAGSMAFDAGRRGPTRTEGGRSFTLDRTQTPNALARQEVERRAAETRDQRNWLAEQNRLDREAAGSGSRSRNIDPLSQEGIRAAADRARQLAAVDTATGGTSVSKPTESQEKSYMYGAMMTNALPIIDEMSKTANTRAISLALGRGVSAIEDMFGPGSVTGDILGENEQRLINAARVFTAGLLRKESGAAITPDELRDTFQRFIPLGNDSRALRAQKLNNRRVALDLMNDMALPAAQYYQRLNRIGSGGNQPSGAQSTTAPTTTPPASGNILEEYAAWKNRETRNAP